MKNRLGIISLVLWVLTVGIFGIYFVKGATTVSSDQRRAILLSPSEKDLVLGEMRTMLEAVSGVLGALSENDMKKAAVAASSAGMAMAVDATPVFMAKLPLDFKELGMGTHKAFDEISADISKGATLPEVLKSMYLVTNRCVACHQANRLATSEAYYDKRLNQFALNAEESYEWGN
jgi:mono/diheme cytochrome c family protein